MLIHIEIAYLYLLFLAALPSVFGNNKKSKDSRWRPRKQQLATWHHSVRPERGTRASRPGPTYLKYRVAPSPTVRPRISLSLSLVRHPSSLRAPGRRRHRPDAMDPSPVAASSRGAAGGARRCWRGPRQPQACRARGTITTTWSTAARPRSNPEAMDGVTTKLVTGDAGYVLEDVPHLSDYLPDLPVSAAVPRGVCIVLHRSIWGSGMGSGWSVDRCCERKTPPMFGVPLRWGWPESWNLAMILSLTLENVVASELLIYF
jgi:hypothetical protein